MTGSDFISSISSAEFRALASLLRASGREIESTIRGVSMEPTIPNGARIKVCPPESGDYRIGEIAVCLIEKTQFAHRIVYCGGIGKTSAFVLTQGDRSLLCDPPTRKSEILGVVKAFSVDGIWHVPAGRPSRRPWQQALADGHVRMIEMCLGVHHEFARRVSGTFLTFGSIPHRLRSKLAAK